MAKQLINLGTVVNDGTGDVLRVGAQKINENFTELYTFLENSGGQLSLVSSITADDGLTVNASSGNVLIRANIASTTDLGSIRVGSGLQISEGGVLSIIPQASFNGDYNDLSNKPDLSVYQLAANAFSRNYNDLTGHYLGQLIECYITRTMQIQTSKLTLDQLRKSIKVVDYRTR